MCRGITRRWQQSFQLVRWSDQEVRTTMVPLQAGGSRLWRAVQRIRNWSLTGGLAVSLVLGGLLGQSSLVTAQPAAPAQDPAFFPATGYRIGSPAVFDYFQHRGGVRTFGYPVSNEFPLLGKRVQIFQRQLMEIRPDGSAAPADILDPGVLPITRIDGLTLPNPDPDLQAAGPTPDNPDYAQLAISFISVYVPDEWNGLPVNFQSTFLNTVTCADGFGTEPCDPALLPSFALELWGLPTSLPTSDPINPDFVYQRFQRGIMHFSRATGTTQGLLLGDWLKRVIIGVELSPDLSLEVRKSKFFAQYAPTRPLALDRPADLPDTSLAQAFRSDTLTAAGQGQPEPTLPVSVAQTATAVAQTATAVSATQVALQGTQSVLTATALAATATAAAVAAMPGSPTATPGSVVSDIPVVNIGCLGDEQLWFLPRKPNIGVHVEISVTSRRHHDARAIRLTGPLDPGPVTERVGPLGFIWTWTVVPAVEAFHEWTFYADGLRPCITSGFNAAAPLGATPTPTATPKPTDTPGPTATPTTQGPPNATNIDPTSGTCDTAIRISGTNFGVPQTGSLTPSNAQALFGSRQAVVLSWTNTNVLIQGPPAGAVIGNAYSITVVNSGGSSTAPQRFTLTSPPTGPGTPVPTTC
jgi:IPT/TIG domain